MDLIAQRIRLLVAARFGVMADIIEPATSLVKDLGADSLGMMSLIFELEKEFNVDIKVGDAFAVPDFQALVELVRSALNQRPEPLQPL